MVGRGLVPKLAAAAAAVMTATSSYAMATTDPNSGWESWLKSFGHDNYAYPAWITAQMRRCSCARARDESIACTDESAIVDWRTAESLTWCVAKQFLVSHMPEFDLHFLPGAVSVDGTSMLDDNIAFTLMAWNASALLPRPPIAVALSYLLPYATMHEPRVNWRPIFFAKYFASAVRLTKSRDIVDALIGGGTRLMNWTDYKWQDFGGLSPKNAYELGPFASGSTPPVIGQFDFLAYGYGSCTGWAKFLASALKAVGVPAREVGSPCWNTIEFSGLAKNNPNVSFCWNGGLPGGPFGGKYLNNHNWVEYWDNVLGDWRFVDVATSSGGETTWFCGQFSRTPGRGGCSCSSNAGKASQDHEILAMTWSPAGAANPEVDGGTVLDVMTELRLTNGQAVSPLVWSPRLLNALGEPLKNVGLRVVNRTDFYRCQAGGNVPSNYDITI